MAGLKVKPFLQLLATGQKHWEKLCWDYFQTRFFWRLPELRRRVRRLNGGTIITPG
nr:MAG: hypothetical protein [Bacteriophage sp.]